MKKYNKTNKYDRLYCHLLLGNAVNLDGFLTPSKTYYIVLCMLLIK